MTTPPPGRPAKTVFYRSPGEDYPTAVSASGLTITDSSGRDYLDMSGGAAVSCLGHGHPEVVRAITRQLERLDFAHTRFFTSEPQEALAGCIAGRFGPSGTRVYFTSGGSEANETALKLAWQYWAAMGQPARKVIISREHSYHGNTFGALSVSGNDGRRRASAAPLLDWPRIPPCYEYRERLPGETLEAYALRSADYLDDAIRTIGSETVAAFICEPVVGSSLGVVPAVPGYLKRIREICDRHGILFIADEVMCGSGRTGTFFAHEPDGVRPDMVTLAKGLAGGFQPLAATVLAPALADVLGRSGFAHGHTYVGHPVACAAGLAVQTVIERDGLLAKTVTLGTTLLRLLTEALGSHPLVGDIRGRGLFAAIELVSDRQTRRGFTDGRDLPEAIRRAAMAEGLICYPAGITLDGRTVPHVMLAPPMISEPADLQSCVAKLVSALGSVFPKP